MGEMLVMRDLGLFGLARVLSCPVGSGRDPDLCFLIEGNCFDVVTVADLLTGIWFLCVLMG
jgi:hypothetical protein